MRARAVLVNGNNRSLCALDFIAFVLLAAFSSPPISLQLRVQCSSSMVLCMETQNSDYAALPSSPWSFFFFTLWQCPLTATLTSHEAKWASLQCFIQQDRFWNWEGIVGGGGLGHQVCSHGERGEGTRWMRSAATSRRDWVDGKRAGSVRLCASRI